ncbi:putative septum formation protein [Candidatus Methylobacter favarea]|uniref:dTTP/UTP pyrophosphatase n=1 Tax=Candidatus Methylobacter favarea TaxID=2707345 RepID=A0A8S0XTT7_9GAMM|nr:Maf family protein [Candidatus Methylobacter favarea]CAA9891968.1 putative septum formation protein [Candidatus Methylobacter favarea]
MTAHIILASASPRRQELLGQIKVIYVVRPVDLDETFRPDEEPLNYVQRMAAEKSALGLANSAAFGLPVLAADTVVVLDNRVMGKPKDQHDALAMSRQLSGKTHQVYTAVSLRGRGHDQAVSITDVSFRHLAEREILAYWNSGEPAGKAGGYAIQGMGAVFVESIKGSFSGVMGLPLFETAELLSRQGIEFL